MSTCWTSQVSCWRFFFFFQAEDGIRDRNVTGVQTCALPIWAHRVAAPGLVRRDEQLGAQERRGARVLDDVVVVADEDPDAAAVRRVEHRVAVAGGDVRVLEDRSEERRVGKDGWGWEAGEA